jgi:hypothetical protein
LLTSQAWCLLSESFLRWRPLGHFSHVSAYSADLKKLIKHAATLQMLSIQSWCISPSLKLPDFGHLTNLVFLSIQAAPPSPSELCANIAAAKSLRYLRLHVHGITDSDLSFLDSTFHLMEELLIGSSGVMLNSTTFSRFATQLTNLRALSLDQPQYMTDAILHSIATMTKLEYLCMMNFTVPGPPEPLSDAGLLSLRSLPRLKCLDSTHVCPSDDEGYAKWDKFTESLEGSYKWNYELSNCVLKLG